MKNIILYFAGATAFCLLFWAFVNSTSSTFEVPKEKITFHEVSLVCNAAPDIGCGSRSKPILLALQDEATIKEAWLNRQGTIIAVVWEETSEPNVKAVPAIFEKYGIAFKTLTGEDYKKQLARFKTDQWYQGSEVDELSMEEAGQIASQIIEKLVEVEALPEENAPRMLEEVKAYIQNEFITLEDVRRLNAPEYYKKWEKAIQKIGKPYVRGGEVPGMDVFYPAGTSCNKKACCTKNKKGCCASF